MPDHPRRVFVVQADGRYHTTEPKVADLRRRRYVDELYDALAREKGRRP